SLERVYSSAWFDTNVSPNRRDGTKDLVLPTQYFGVFCVGRRQASSNVSLRGGGTSTPQLEAWSWTRRVGDLVEIEAAGRVVRTPVITVGSMNLHRSARPHVVRS
ncbi:unnamed protein product, partial [Ectocarpus sp. 12 AP-2014]